MTSAIAPNLALESNINQKITELFQSFHEQIFDPERITLAIAAIIIVTIIGMTRGVLGGNANPFFWHIIDLTFGRFGALMDKPGRLKGDLVFRGFVLSITAMAFSFFIGRAIFLLSSYYPIWSAVEIFALCLLLSSGAVFAAAGLLYRALNDKKVTKGAYYTIARSTRTDLSRSDDFSITRVGMGLVLKCFDKAVVAPIIWYLIAGLPGAYLYAGIAALSWRFGKEGYSGGFGETALALERLMGFVPNLLSGVFIALAGLFTPTAGMSRAFLGLMRVKGRANYAEGGLPVTAAAYALNVSLGGATQDLDGSAIKRNWVGPEKATAQLNAKHLHRVVYIAFMAHLLFLASLSGALVFAQNGYSLGVLPF